MDQAKAANLLAMQLSENTVSRILDLHEKGLSERAIAKEVGCSRSAVWYQIRKSKKQ